MARLSLSLLGTFEAALDGCPLTGFESVNARSWRMLLSRQIARTKLRQVLANLREVLQDRRASVPVLLITRDSVQLDSTLARSHYRETIEMRQELGQKRGYIGVLEGLGELVGAAGHPQRDVLLCGAAAMHEAIRSPVVPAERGLYEAVLATGRAGPDDAAGKQPGPRGTRCHRGYRVCAGGRRVTKLVELSSTGASPSGASDGPGTP